MKKEHKEKTNTIIEVQQDYPFELIHGLDVIDGINEEPEEIFEYVLKEAKEEIQ